MTEETANQTVYTRLSTKKALMLLASFLPPSDEERAGRWGKRTQDDAIRFLLKKAGIDVTDTPEAQTTQARKAVQEEA